MIHSKKQTRYQIVINAIMIIVTLIIVLPFVLVFISSLTEENTLIRNGYSFFPEQLSLYAYQYIIRQGDKILRAYMITIIVTIIGTAANLSLSALIAYPLSVRTLPHRRAITFFVFFTMLFNGGMIPTYLVVSGLGITNTIWALILPAVLNTWYALICKQFFVGIPEEIVEAAKVDGISEFGLFVKIVLPMSTPVLASIGLFTMVGSWNNWFDAMLYLDVSVSHLWPLQYYVTVMFNNMAQISQGDLHDIMNIVGTDAQVADIATRMALTIISFVPILLIYPFFQKYFTKGVYMGSVK